MEAFLINYMDYFKCHNRIIYNKLIRGELS